MAVGRRASTRLARNLRVHERRNRRSTREFLAYVIAARMAVRLARSAASLADHSLPSELGAALRDCLTDDAWVGRAAVIMWNGSAAEAVSAAYRNLLSTVRRLRDVRDQNAAHLLAGATLRDEAPIGTRCGPRTRGRHPGLSPTRSNWPPAPSPTASRQHSPTPRGHGQKAARSGPPRPRRPQDPPTFPNPLSMLSEN